MRHQPRVCPHTTRGRFRRFPLLLLAAFGCRWLVLLLSRGRSRVFFLWRDRSARCVVVSHRALEEEAARKKAQEEEAARKKAQEEEAARKKAQQEEAARKNAQEEEAKRRRVRLTVAARAPHVSTAIVAWSNGHYHGLFIPRLPLQPQLPLRDC
jgi:hypothetical protein